MVVTAVKRNNEKCNKKEVGEVRRRKKHSGSKLDKKEKRKQKWEYRKELTKQQIDQYYKRIRDAISRNLWFEILFMVSAAAIAAGIVFLIVSHTVYSTDLGIREHISYEESRAYVQERLLQTVANINEITNNENSDEEGLSEEMKEQSILDSLDFNVVGNGYVESMQNYLVDSTGKLMYDTDIIESLNLVKVIQKANQSEYSGERNKFIAIYPVIIDGSVCYLYSESTLSPIYLREFTDIGNVVAVFAAIGMFILIIFRLAKDKIAYIEYLSSCLGEISKGNLSYKIEVVGEDELAEVAHAITHMETELKYQIEAQIATEKSKNELVTNVAHDLRTPLTSIIGYINLVKTKAYTTQEEADKYLDIAYNKSEKLRGLIEDLFELTKLHQHGVKLDMKKISLSNLLHQLIEELMPLASEKNIQIETYIDSNNTQIYVDIDKITRVFENLIENAIKYCPKDEEIYIELKSGKENIYIAVSNPAEHITDEEINKFFERFYRADQSRNSTGGSGLGLAIAKNIIELHGGQIQAVLNQDLISFKVNLPRHTHGEKREVE